MDRDDGKKPRPPKSGARPQSRVERRRAAAQKSIHNKSVEIKTNASRKRRHGSSKRMTVMQLKRSLRKGGATTVEYTNRMIENIDSFANNKEIRTPGYFLGIRITFPLFLLICLIIIFLAFLVLDTNTISVDRHTIPVVALPKDLEGYTILHLSDLHAKVFGEEQASLLKTINSLNYNLVLITGDMVGASGNAEPFYQLLQGMTANRPVYFIAGDSDPGPFVEVARDLDAPIAQLVLEDWILGAQELGANYVSAPVKVTVNQSELWLTPDNMLSMNIPNTLLELEEQVEQERQGVSINITSDYHTLPFTTYRYYQLLKLQQAASDMANREFLHIGLAHVPPTQEMIATTQLMSDPSSKTYLRSVDVIFAGHYCGGGWKLPILGAFFIPNALSPRNGWLPDQQDVQGIKNLGVTTLYTSAGLGKTDRIYLPDFRFHNRPQVSLITLTSSIQDDLLGG